MSLIVDPKDELAWNAAICEEYRTTGTITFLNGETISGKPALDLYKTAVQRLGKGPRKVTSKPEDFLPKETKA